MRIQPCFRYRETYRRVGGVYRSMIEVRLMYRGTTSTTHLGVVDSGAARTVLPVEMAEEVGIGDLDSLPQRRLRGVGGSVAGREGQVELLVLGHRFTASVLFGPTPYILLGRADLFRVLQVGFDERAQELLIEPY